MHCVYIALMLQLVKVELILILFILSHLILA